MSSIKKLKKDINYIFGEVIDEINFKQLLNPEVAEEKVEELIDEAVAAYEIFYKKIHAGRKAENVKSYFKNLTGEINEAVEKLMDKIEAL